MPMSKKPQITNCPLFKRFIFEATLLHHIDDVHFPRKKNIQYSTINDVGTTFYIINNYFVIFIYFNRIY